MRSKSVCIGCNILHKEYYIIFSCNKSIGISILKKKVYQPRVKGDDRRGVYGLSKFRLIIVMEKS